MYLNKEQQDIIKYDSNEHVCIIAGAGTGKTFTLVEKIKYNLINNNYRPDEILVLTFTRKAANEIKNRIIESTGYEIDTYTYHSFMYRCLKQIDTYKEYTIADEKQIRDIYKQFIKSNDYLNTPKYDELVIMKYLNAMLYSKFQEYLESIKVLSFDLIVEKATYIINMLYKELQFTDSNKLYYKNLYNYITKYKYIYLDEFQDTDKQQMAFLEDFIKITNSIVTMVGDPHQSIYVWRGAYSENMNEFKQKFNMKNFTLKKNYRSDANIIYLANKIYNNLDPIHQRRNKVHVYSCNNDVVETQAIINRIKYYLSFYSYNDIVILSRLNGILRRIEPQLIKNNIPYHIAMNKNLFDKIEIKVIFEYIKLLINPCDISAFKYLKKYLNIRGIGDKTLNKVNESYSIIDLIEERGKNQSFINEYNQLKEISNPVLLINEIINRLNLNELFKDEEERLDNINIFVDFVKSIKSLDEILDLYLMFMSEVDIGNNKVNLMTVHAAKGLEFPVVLFVGLEDGTLPSNNSTIDEETNILYVALTRAKEHLNIFTSTTRYFRGLERYPTSLFANVLELYSYKNPYIIYHNI